MKILLLAPKGFEILEFSALFDVLAWANNFGYNTKVITCGFQKQVSSAFGLLLTVDTLVDDINLDDYDALAITGSAIPVAFKFLELLTDSEKMNEIKSAMGFYSY